MWIGEKLYTTIARRVGVPGCVTLAGYIIIDMAVGILVPGIFYLLRQLGFWSQVYSTCWDNWDSGPGYILLAGSVGVLIPYSSAYVMSTIINVQLAYWINRR